MITVKVNATFGVHRGVHRILAKKGTHFVNEYTLTEEAAKELADIMESNPRAVERGLHTILAQVTISAPRVFWRQFEEVFVGESFKPNGQILRQSITAGLTKEMFDYSYMTDTDTRKTAIGALDEYIEHLNELILSHAEAQVRDDMDKARDIRNVIYMLLPDNLMETRTMMMSYEMIQLVLKKRKGKQAKWWEDFREIISRELPLGKELLNI